MCNVQCAVKREVSDVELCVTLGKMACHIENVVNIITICGYPAFSVIVVITIIHNVK